MQATPLRAVGYRRVSHQEQVEGYSLEAQEVHIQNYVQMQGWVLVKIYTDAGISAKKGSHRPAFEQMLKDAKEGSFDVIVVDKIDRFYRHLGGLLTALDQLNNLGVSLASVQEKLDFTNPWGKLMLTVLGMLAELYIENLRQETKKGQRQRARRGLWVGGIPYGYCQGLCSVCEDPNGMNYCPNYGSSNLSDGKRLIAHPIESIAVKLVYEWYLNGTYSAAMIAKKLSQYKITLPNGNEVQIRQKGRKGYSNPGVFSRDTIRDILQRVAYTGKLPLVGVDDNGKYRSRKPPLAVFEGLHPALITQEMFDQAAKIREATYRSPHVKFDKPVHLFILTGILRCGYCGANMRGISSKKRYYYRDASRSEAVLSCEQGNIRADKFEDTLAELIKKIVFASDTNQATQNLLTEFTRAEERFKRARELYLAGQMSRSDYQAECAQFEEFDNDLPENRLHATMALASYLRSDLSRWNALSSIEKKRLLRLVLEGAWVRGNALAAIQPTIAFLPLFGETRGCNCGEGGI